MNFLTLQERADLHRTCVGEIERGERNPSIDVMDRLAQGLSVSLSELPSAQCYDLISNRLTRISFRRCLTMRRAN